VVYHLPLPVGVGGPGGSGCVSMLGPLFACSGRGPRGYIRGEVCGAGPDHLRPPSKHSAPTVLCRARRGVPGHASCVLAVPVFSSGVLTRDYREHGTVAPWAGGGRAVVPYLVEQQGKEDILCLLRGAPRARSSRPSSPAISSLALQPRNARLASPKLGPYGQGWA